MALIAYKGVLDLNACINIHTHKDFDRNEAYLKYNYQSLAE